MKVVKNILIGVMILALGVVTRFYGNHFDDGLFMHPDERMLMFVAQRIQLFSKLDPEFFAYGTLPVYILKGIMQMVAPLLRINPADFGALIAVGRVLSSLLDMMTAGIIMLITYRLSSKFHVAVFAVLFYLFSFFPLQNSNFFIVDNFVNAGVSLLFYLILVYLDSPGWKTVVGLAVIAAALLATKVTPVIFIPFVLGILFVNIRAGRLCLTNRPIRTLGYMVLFVVLFFAFHFLFMPYAYFSFSRFWSEIQTQVKMNNDPFVFPYTLLYVGTKPYLYYIYNILFWGVGPVVSVFFLTGLMAVMREFLRAVKSKQRFPWAWLIYLLLNAYYFLVIGRSAVKFMRYMLPLYPFIAVMAGYGLDRLRNSPRLSRRWQRGLPIWVFVFAALWLLPFVNIYSQRHTRKQASEWMEANIPAGSVLAHEHWDERLPCFGGQQFQYVELNMYDLPDDERKWEKMNQKIAQAEYIIVASQKLYVPLQRLEDCRKHKSCYPRAKKYYQDLFSGQLGFSQVAQFTSYPRFPLLPKKWEIVDDNADESFSVYDHPRVYIFKRRLGK